MHKRIRCSTLKRHLFPSGRKKGILKSWSHTRFSAILQIPPFFRPSFRSNKVNLPCERVLGATHIAKANRIWPEKNHMGNCMDMNVDKERKDLPKDSDISSLLLGEKRDPKSKFQSGGCDQTLLRLQRSLLSMRAWAAAQGCLSSPGWWSETPLEFPHYRTTAWLLAGWCKMVLHGKHPRVAELGWSPNCALKERAHGIYSSSLLPRARWRPWKAEHKSQQA